MFAQNEYSIPTRGWHNISKKSVKNCWINFLGITSKQKQVFSLKRQNEGSFPSIFEALNFINVPLNIFIPNATFLYPSENIRKPLGIRKISENHNFHGVHKGCIGNEWVHTYDSFMVCPMWYDRWHESFFSDRLWSYTSK